MGSLALVLAACAAGVTLATTASATAAPATVATVTTVSSCLRFGGGFGRCVGLVGCAAGGWGGRAAEQALEPGNKSFFSRRGGLGHWRRCGCRRSRSDRRWFGRLGHDGRRHVGQHALDHWLLFVVFFLVAPCDGGRVFKLLGHLVARRNIVQACVVVLEPLELVVGRLQRLVGHEQHRDALLHLDLGNFAALLIEQEGGHLHRHLAVHGGGVVLHGVFLNDAQDLQRRAFRVADMAGSAAARAGNGGAFREGRPQALSAHLEQAELADRAKLHAGAVLAQRIAQAVFHFPAVLAFFHVDEIDHDQAAKVAQAHLARHFVGGLQVGAGGRLLNVAALDGPRRVDVD